MLIKVLLTKTNKNNNKKPHTIQQQIIKEHTNVCAFKKHNMNLALFLLWFQNNFMHVYGLKIIILCWALSVVVHAFNPSAWEAEKAISLSWRPAWSL